MIILGVDPGYATTGTAILEKLGNSYRPIYYGPVLTKPDTPFDQRLNILYTAISDLIEQYHPEAMAVEELFYFKNAKTVITVAEARGVIVLAAARHDLPIFEYTPLQVKQAVVGYGRAEKEQVQRMVKNILHLDKIPKPDDVADALAVALCHGQSYTFNKLAALR